MSSSTCRSRKRKPATLEKLLVILDIDQTLVHSTNKESSSSGKSNFTVWDKIRNEQLHVYTRPYLQLFLDELFDMECNKIVEVAIYTAGTQDYADEVLKSIDSKHRIKHRFYRQDCLFD